MTTRIDFSKPRLMATPESSPVDADDAIPPDFDADGFEGLPENDEADGPELAPVTEVQASTKKRREGFNLTDTGNAERFALMHRGRARFVPKWGHWIVYDGKRWAKDSAGVRVAALAKRTVRSIYGEAAKVTDPDHRKALVGWARRSEGRAGRESMVALARAEDGLAVEHDELDVDPWLFNVANGTVDLRTGKLRPHAPTDLLTKLASVKYDEAAECPRFERFLEEIMIGDLERVEFLRRFLGYCLTGDVREHCLTFWHGREGGNGKSTLTTTLFTLMGDYATKAAPDLLFRSAKTDRHPTELADLFGARLVLCNETSRDRSWDLPTVKDITGGDTIKARRMHEDFWSFQPTHKVVVFGNNRPRIDDPEDGGIKRRLRLVPFEVSFSGNPDRGLDATLRKESPGILAYLVRGCLAWQADGLTSPTAITEATAEYFAEQDTVARFVAERCDLNPLAKVSRRDLRIANEAWAEESGEPKPNPKELAAWLTKHGVTECAVRDGRGPVKGWRGIWLRREVVQAGDDRAGAA